MRNLKSGILILTMIIMVITASTLAKSPSLLLQEGLYAEETQGDLDKAINTYKKVLKQYNDVERIAAQATYQLGLCYLKKDNKEKAADYFQEVIGYFPEQTTIVQEAKIQLRKIKPINTQSIEIQIISYLLEQHQISYKNAKKTGIKSNSIIYYIDETNVKTQGGMTTIENDSKQVIDSEITVGNFGTKNITDIYDENLILQQTRFEDTGNSMGRYALKWTPKQPFQPGEIKTFIYKAMDDVLPKSNNGFSLEMTNHFGPEVLENFFLILPANMRITKGLDNIKTHKKIKNFDVYLWQKIVPANTTHSRIVDVEINKEYPDSAKPAVIESFPETYSNDVSPDINQITVTFDQDMFQHGWSWCQTGSNEIFPEIIAKPKYIDSKTCVLPVKVKPAKSYLVLVNTAKYHSFKNTNHIPAREYALVFSTKDAQGNPTEISPELLKKAEDINTRNAIPKPILDIIPPAVGTYIADEFYATFDKAQKKGLKTNSHIHIIDQDFNRSFGMISIFKNHTSQIIDREIPMGSNDSPEIYIYDENGTRQIIRTAKIPNSNYRYFWTPSEPVEPDEARMLFYSSGTRMLSIDENGQCKLKLQNHFGPPAIEDFYVVLPCNMELTYQSEPFTSFETIEGFNIYCWSKEQPKNFKHRVDIEFAKKD